MTDIVDQRAVDQAAMLRRKEISASELLEEHLKRIDDENPELNAIVTLVPDIARGMAKHADDVLADGGAVPLLTGLPVAHKDLHETKGIRTTFGSPLHADFVPDRTTLIVERMQAAGAVTVGKTNTPQHGAGSQTFNEIFGTTLNPWDTALTPGGSSGGAAVAVATGMASLADGSDYGASLRNPASFTNTVGFRPSPGRIPSWPTTDAWWTHSVQGPIGRTVEDISLFMAATAGPDPRVPISIETAGSEFATPLARDWTGIPMAWSDDLGGLPIEPAVTAALAPARDVLSDIGFAVTEACPDFAGAEQSFQTWRGYYYVKQFGDGVIEHPESYKDSIKWNVEYGRSLTAADLGAATTTRTRLRARVLRFLDEHRFLAIPTSTVLPFPITTEYPTQINGTPMDNYTSWFASCYYISTLELPTISIPGGFTESGLPVGLQIVGRHHADIDVLKAAFAFQQATEHWKRRPPTIADLERR